MRTLREYIDLINELNRRDFLKGVGGAVAGAAAGSAGAFSPASSFYQGVFVGGVQAAAQEKQRTMPLPELNITASTDANAVPSEQLSSQDQETIIMVVQSFILNKNVGGDVKYRSQALEILNNLVTVWNIRPLLKSRYDQIIKHHEDKQKNDPAYFERLKRVYTTSKEIQIKIYDQGMELVEKGRKLSKIGSAKEPEKEIKQTQDSGAIKPGFEGKMLDTGMVLFVYARLNNHESLPRIRSALGAYISKTGLGDEIKRRIKEIQENPSQFGPSTRPEQYFRQADQIISDIYKLASK